MKRSDHWKEPRYFEPVIIESDENPEFERLRERAPKRDEDQGGVLWSIIGCSKELIFKSDGGVPRFQAVSFSIDARHLDFVLDQSFEISGLDDDDEVKEILAIALSEDVPVYPEDDEAAVVLARLHSELLQHGFETTLEGRRARLIYNRPRAFDLRTSNPLQDYRTTASVSPADILAIRTKALVKQRDLERAHRTMAVLEGAIEELDRALIATKPNESALQAVLTNFPVLFGLDYARIIPKHRLGAEFEMDYALERHSGLVDLVEIEASSHRLYTKAGNPTAALVHAEQQVLDWLEWIDAHGPYSRIQLAGLWRPIAYVIIGRSSTLTAGETARLRRRNVSWSGTISILTYDDLLERARGILSGLTGHPAGSASKA